MHFFVIYHKIVFFNSVIVRLYDVEKYEVRQYIPASSLRADN